ncbi:nuclear transport factor 2 family protein [Streptomyces meridianus]|uniref:Nuclear transport factor 2 family protein n=1 Tax=Streptomyces meridianus TaxID=2938945 RepID=A0ABT0WZV4_9ACTN|nr:nuclear transport factor 2 family protein [Streptomyces meridianus]MCM2575851.1 nuclear transport factor 2 family protein [Streptomyces meridianus]
MSSETDATDDVQVAIAGELRLHDPAVRASRSAAEQLLDPDFVEVGKSGRRWKREEMLAELPAFETSRHTGPRIEVSRMTGVQLAPGLVHLTYETVVGGARARRSSLWRKGDDGTGWRVYYHHATPVPPGTA